MVQEKGCINTIAMHRSKYRPILITCSLLSLALTSVDAATIWNGPAQTFTKANNTDCTLSANQDRITPQTWITRDLTAGLFNIAKESTSSTLSPTNTEWAYGSTTNMPTTFTNWYGWNGHNPTNTIGKPAVVHLISEDVYIDIKFTAFTSGGGGGFAYERSGFVALTLKGPAFTAVNRFGTFTDPGAAASNSAGAALTVSVEGSVNTSLPGDYLLTYSATDTLGFAATTNRLVSVLETNSAPSWWLAQYGLGSNITASLLDSDGDGVTNWVEYLTGTNPTNAQSVFRVSALPGGEILVWTSLTDRVYSIYQTTNLSQPFTLIPGSSNLPATPPRNAFTNTDFLPAQFFRIGVQLKD